MKKYLIILATAVLTLSSCSDFLERHPLDRLSPENYFRTEEELQLFSNTFYNNLLDKSVYKHQSDVFVEYELNTWLKGGTFRTVPASGGAWTWGDLRKINTMLEYIHNCPDQKAVTQYTGVCKFFRAFIYNEKLERFGDVPWVDVQPGSADPIIYAPRDNREVVAQNIIQDLDDAIASLPTTSVVYRVNKWTALALKARFCLFEGTFRKYHAGADYLKNLPADAKDYSWYLDQAAAAAKEIIEGGHYKLYKTGNPDKDYVNLFAMYDATGHNEYILAINFDRNIPIRHRATAYATMPTQGRPGFTKKFINTYLMADGTRFTDKPGWETMSFLDETKDRDPRLGQTIRIPGYKRLGGTKVESPLLSLSMTGYQPVKFVQDIASGADGQTEMSFNDLPVFRLGEVYLNYAEALAENDKITQHDLDISVNLLRQRAGMPAMNMADANAHPDSYLLNSEYGYSNVTGANQGVILEIRRERGIELAQEDMFRFFDLVRWKEGKCVDQNMYGIYFPGPGSYDLSGDGIADVVLYAAGESVKDAPQGADVLQIGKDIMLSENNKGYVDPHYNQTHTFDESRDYLYPIPSDERSLNHNLTQNPNWNDGLSF